MARSMAGPISVQQIEYVRPSSNPPVGACNEMLIRSPPYSGSLAWKRTMRRGSPSFSVTPPYMVHASGVITYWLPPDERSRNSVSPG